LYKYLFVNASLLYFHIAFDFDDMRLFIFYNKQLLPSCEVSIQICQYEESCVPLPKGK
jgi:hypothetical protein